jgi:hypothetical protein
MYNEKYFEKLIFISQNAQLMIGKLKKIKLEITTLF